MATYDYDTISEDSDLYGENESFSHDGYAKNHEEAASLYWSYHGRLPAVLAQKGRPKASAHASSGKPYNPFEGQHHNARQLDETPNAFVKRLPPSTTHNDAAGAWLWIADPHQKHEFLDHDYSRLRENGEHLLDHYKEYKQQMKKTMQAKAASTITKRLRPAQARLAEDIRNLALKCNIKSGKWMLFPRTDILDRTWDTICEAVVNGKLGSSAKVATAGAERGEGGVRLICVYTDDFTDDKDVRRVLDELARLRLIGDAEGRGIWYKMDAYTHLGIESGNEYGLKASLFGSQNLLKA